MLFFVFFVFFVVQSFDFMHSLLATTLDHLRVLVSHDTQNPPRAIGTDGIFEYVRSQLIGFDWSITDHGGGAVSFFAVRGKPRMLFNVHLDTVPATPTWSGNPFELIVSDERAIGLGACDIKGAAAALLTAAARTRGDMALLFTSDEEANDARCVATFLGQKRRFDAVIVAEPTRCEAVLAHRGISSVRATFAGRAGHASTSDALTASAVHQAMRWGARALAQVDSLQHERFGGLTGLRFNIGRVEGGIKANVIAPSADVRFGFRPLPSMDTDALLESFRRCADPAPGEFVETFRGPSLPAGNVAQAESRRLAARDLADELGLTIGNAVDFWTEASLFSAAGYTAFVCGPGDIAQAHSAGEYVELSQLQQITNKYIAMIDQGTTHAGA
jgi:acetylornithine deacetylase